MKRLGLSLGLVGIALIGCKEEEHVESVDIRTSGMYAAMDVVADGSGDTDVRVELRVGGDDGTIVDLAEEDKLMVTVGDSVKTLNPSGDVYRATVAGDEGGVEVKISFVRSDEDESALNSVVMLPERFEIEGAEFDTNISRATGELVVTWEPSDVDVDMRWTLDTDNECMWDTEGDMNDSGSLTISGDDFDSTPSADGAVDDPEDNSEVCVATLCIYRDIRGQLDPEFDVENEGGYIRASQKVCGQFISIP